MSTKYYGYFAISITLFLQLNQTRRSLLKTEVKLRMLEPISFYIEQYYKYIQPGGATNQYLFTYNRFNAWLIVYIKSQYNEACYKIVNVVVDVKVTFTNYEEYLKKRNENTQP